MKHAAALDVLGMMQTTAPADWGRTDDGWAAEPPCEAHAKIVMPDQVLQKP